MTDLVPRPVFHFTPERNWMNDPNGLVYIDGVWHMYFQYNPDGADWGHMSWGHATSSDLIRWTEHPVALRFTEQEQIFSGSIVASSDDARASDEADLLTAVYTSAYATGRQAQSVATSNDGGFTWERFADNPVLDRGTRSFRDPKVIRFRDERGSLRWVLVAVEADERQVLFYTSTDLRSWDYLSTLGPIGDEGVVWECPDLLRLALDGNPHDTRWVLTLSTNPIGDQPNSEGSSMSYLIGDFDGTTFTPETEGLARLDGGHDFYAGVTFDNAPGGTPIMIGWMGNWRYAHTFPTAPWRGAMSLPRKLSLGTVDGATRLIQEPPDFAAACLDSVTLLTDYVDTEPLKFSTSSHALVGLSWNPADTGTLRLHLRGETSSRVEIVHDVDTATMSVDRGGTAAETVHPDFPATSTVHVPANEPVRLLISLDGPLLEVFVNGGVATVSDLVMLGRSGVNFTVSTERRGAVTRTEVDVLATPVSAQAATYSMDLSTTAKSAR